MSSSSYPSLFDVWSRTSSHVFNSVLEANRAAIAAMGVPDAENDDDMAVAPTPQEPRAEDRIVPDEDLPEWDSEVDAGGATLTVGDRVRFTKTVSEEDVERFAVASGDTNPLHLDSTWAQETRFRGRIVHGTLVSGLISAALARLPGGVVYLSQDVEFKAPVRIDDRITADVEVVEDLGGGRFRLRTRVLDGEDVVIDGEAVILVDDLPEFDD
jgi:3-hydroxybutyryl-CoA dehydratase